MQDVDRVNVERIGGLAGFGLPGSHLKSRGEVALSELSAADRSAVESLFEPGSKPGKQMPDAFRYRITRQTPKGPQTIEVSEDRVPMVLQNCVKDELE